jgi:hypothetical protein
MTQSPSVALKAFIIRTCPPSVRRQMLTWSEQAQVAASHARQAVAAIGPLPHFLIIGAQKGGTTYLYDEMVRHPAIASARIKEIHYFDINYRRGNGWYQAFFPRRPQGTGDRPWLTGEASPGYLFHPHSAKRAHGTVPKAKLIVLLRNPVERAYSHYQHEVRLGYETLPFEQAIAQERDRLCGEKLLVETEADYYSLNCQHYSYLARGIYVDQLRVWQQHFPANQLLVLQSEDFQRNIGETLERVFSFLGLPIWQPPQWRTAKVFPYPQIDAALRDRLKRFFAPHNQRLFAELGVDYGWND